jgi:hypothetical protein
MLYDCFYLYQYIIEGRKERLRGINVEFENNDEIENNDEKNFKNNIKDNRMSL